MLRLFAGAAISRPQTAPPVALLDPANPTPNTPTVLASTVHAEEAGTDPSSPASATTAHMQQQQQKKRGSEARDSESTQSAPCLGGLGKRRASEPSISVQMGVKRSRPRLAHVESAIRQVAGPLTTFSSSHQFIVMLLVRRPASCYNLSDVTCQNFEICS